MKVEGIRKMGTVGKKKRMGMGTKEGKDVIKFTCIHMF